MGCIHITKWGLQLKFGSIVYSNLEPQFFHYLPDSFRFDILQHFSTAATVSTFNCASPPLTVFLPHPSRCRRSFQIPTLSLPEEVCSMTFCCAFILPLTTQGIKVLLGLYRRGSDHSKSRPRGVRCPLLEPKIFSSLALCFRNYF